LVVDVRQEYERLNQLRGFTNVPKEMRAPLEAWRDAAWSVISKGENELWDGCYWLLHADDLQYALNVPAAAPEVRQAAVALVRWRDGQTLGGVTSKKSPEQALAAVEHLPPSADASLAAPTTADDFHETTPNPFDSAPPADGKIAWKGPLEGSLEQLAEWSKVPYRSFKKRHGKSVFYQRLQKGKHRLWFASQADFASAAKRKEETQTSANAHKQTRTRTTSKSHSTK
jgi:hypothetical protein